MFPRYAKQAKVNLPKYSRRKTDCWEFHYSIPNSRTAHSAKFELARVTFSDICSFFAAFPFVPLAFLGGIVKVGMFLSVRMPR